MYIFFSQTPLRPSFSLLILHSLGYCLLEGFFIASVFVTREAVSFTFAGERIWTGLIYHRAYSTGSHWKGQDEDGGRKRRWRTRRGFVHAMSSCPDFFPKGLLGFLIFSKGFRISNFFFRAFCFFFFFWMDVFAVWNFFKRKFPRNFFYFFFWLNFFFCNFFR